MEIGESCAVQPGGDQPISGSAQAVRWVQEVVPKAKPWRGVAFGTAALALLGIALLIDIPVARFCVHGGIPPWIGKFLNFMEPFGRGEGAIIALLIIYRLDTQRRAAVGRVAAMAFGAGLAAEMIKLCVGRMRPRAFDFATDVFGSFVGWFPRIDSSNMGFPSGHTATGIGLALALAWLYPRGRDVFITLAVLVGLQRIASSAHFPSDVLCGAALGWLAAMLCLKHARVSAWFDRFEAVDRPHTIALARRPHADASQNDESAARAA